MLGYLSFRGQRDTIFAPASGSGRAAIAVVRVSGPASEAALRALSKATNLPEPRRATLRSLKDPKSGELLDRALVVRFSAPRSFTGEDMLEIYVTGGRAVLSAVLEALSNVTGLRPSEPGEFAWRAFENGKLDLSEVEGLADLVDAETAVQRRQALRVAGGHLRLEAEAIRALLLDAMTTLESLIDFADVEDSNSLRAAEAQTLAAQAWKRIGALLANSKAGERLRDGMVVVISGPPNAGKSTLMNALARRDVSIVSTMPGTTRDLVEVSMDLHGFPITLVDTAGIRDSEDLIEQEGVARARRRAAEADLTLWLTEAGSERIPQGQAGGRQIAIRTKIDGYVGLELDRGLGISALTGEGLPELIFQIEEAAAEQFNGASGSLITTERHRIAFEDAGKALERVFAADMGAIELIAEDLRMGARALERIGGRIEVEDVLSGVFGRLCVGK